MSGFEEFLKEIETEFNVRQLFEALMNESKRVAKIETDPYRPFYHKDKLEPKGFGTYIGPTFDKDLLFKFLVKAVCPIVCKGYRVPETIDANGYRSDDWHEICENKAHRAMKELGYE